MGRIPTLEQSAELMRTHWEAGDYPALVYVETTNFCNARCTYCPYTKMERPVEYMRQATFEAIARKVKQRGLKIGAMFCFGEPLADAGLFDKIRYGYGINVMTEYLGLNTNVSLLTADKSQDVLDTCGNITLSFVNTGAEFERLTGLDWEQCYGNAVAFIKYRDAHKPTFIIEIGCNDVEGHDRQKVRDAFKGYRVEWARDAEIRWRGEAVTGMIDRSVLYPEWACDGYRGYMQIKPNGDCCVCAYDVVRSETKFANVLTDNWETIARNFKALWAKPSPFCQRCDFWWNYKQLVAGGYKRGPHIDMSWCEQYEGATTMSEGQ